MENEIKIGDTVRVIWTGELIKVLNIVHIGPETHNPEHETRINYDKGSIDIDCCVFYSRET